MTTGDAQSLMHARFVKLAFHGGRLSVWILLLGTLLVDFSGCTAKRNEADALSYEVIKLHQAGKYQQAIPLAQKALALNEKILGSENASTATSLNHLAELYRMTGDYAKAEPLDQRALMIDEKLFGPESSETATDLNHLALIYIKLGAFAKAEPLYQHALKINEKILGPEHPTTATILVNLAGVYLRTGNYTKARPLIERGLRIYEKVRGPEDLDTAAVLLSLAELDKETAMYPAAILLYQRGLRIFEKTLGPDHPQTALCLGNLALVYQEMSDYAKAETLFQRDLQIDEKTLGPEHPQTATVLNNLAGLYRELGQYSKAEPLYQRALQIDQKVLGPKHPDTASRLSNLGELYSETGEYTKAEAFSQRALTISEKVLGPEHPDTAIRLNNLAVLYKETGEYAKAEATYQRALAINTKVLGAEHPGTALSLSNLGKLYQTSGDYSKAESFCQHALKINEKILGPEHPATATSLDNLAQLYQHIGDYSQAELFYQRVLQIREKTLGAEHPATGISVGNLGRLYAEAGEYSKAQPLLERALTIQEKVFGPDLGGVADGLTNLAILYKEMGKYSEAEPFLQRALLIREKILGPEHPETARSLNNLGGIYNSTQAEPFYQRALKIFEKVLGPENPETAIVQANLALVMLDTNKIAQAHTLAVRYGESKLRILANILSFCSESQRLAYQETLYPYTLFAGIAGSDCELASTCFRYKGIVLDSIIEDRLLAESGRSDAAKHLLETLSADKQQLGQLLLEVRNVPGVQIAKRIRQLEQNVGQIEGELGRQAAGLGQARRALTVTVKEVQAAIPYDGALIEYLRYQHFLGRGRFEPRYAAIVLLAKGQPRWVPLGRADEIEQNVRRYCVQVHDPDTTEKTLQETLERLFQQLWAPLQGALSAKKHNVIISPDSQLNFVSFATLLSSRDRFLAEDYGIRYVSSGRDLLQKINLAPNSQLISFGNPDFGVELAAGEKVQAPGAQQFALRGKTRQGLEELEFPTLPGTKAESAMLAEKCKEWGWQGTSFLSAEASEAELRKVKSPHILHLATHGFFIDAKNENRGQPVPYFSTEIGKTRYFENPMRRAGLALAGAQATLDAWQRGDIPPTENDGIVTAEEVGALKLGGTWLVTLSACNTGFGEAKSGEGVLGLRRAFIQAGAQHLLMTLWPINDETTVDIMAEFYEAAHKSGNAPLALANVQRDWLVKLRKTNGLMQAVNLAGPFILSSQGKPDN